MMLLIGGYGLVRVQREEAQLLAEEQRRLAVTARALQIAVENSLRDRQIADIRRLLAEVVAFQEEIDRIRIFDLHLKPLLVSNPLAIGEDVPVAGLMAAMGERQPVTFFDRQKGHLALYTLVPLRGTNDRVRGAMEIVRLAGGVDAKLWAGRRDVMERIGLLTVGLAVLVWIGVRQSVLRPIGRLMAGVRALAEGRSEPIPVRGRDEFARLARAFNDMADRLAEAHRQLVAETEARLDLARHLRQTEQLVVAGRIASEVAHEVGTPLNIISGRAEYVLGELSADDPRATHLRTIIGQIDRISGIIASLLDVVRPGKAEIQPVVVAPVLGSVIELLRPTARKKGLTLLLDVGPGTRALADPNQLQQVVINLVINAIEATPAGGGVTVAAGPAPGPEGTPGVSLRVIDSGSGISRENLARVFDPFFTTKPPGQGTGLGLAICRGIVREHGGSIDVSSEVGVGTTCRIWLPAPAEVT
jgi:signal transduction histidine kinase